MKKIIPFSFTYLGILLTLHTVSAAPENDRWRWSNPLPHGNNVLDMNVSEDFSTQVGDAGTLYRKGQDDRWAPAVTGTENYLRSVTRLGGLVIAVGENGTICWSDGGMLFQASELSPVVTNDWFEGVTVSSQRAVAVGDYGTIYTSSNGATWVAAESGTEEWLRGVAFGNDGFVAVGESGTILKSTNGLVWNSVPGGTSEHLNRVRYLDSSSGGQFYAVGNSGVLLRSADGSAWMPVAAVTTNDLYDVAINNQGLLVVGDQEIRVSPDNGATWEDQIAVVSNAPPAWAYLSAQGKGDNWLVAGRSGLLMEGRSNDSGGFDWTSSPTNSSHAWIWDMTVQNGIYIAVGDLADIKTSLDGILWTRETVPVSYTNTVLLGVGGTTNALVAVGNDGTVLLSEAGFSEMTVTNDIGGLPVITNISVETYGIVWTALAPFTDTSLQGIDARNNLFVTCGEAGSIFTSIGGTNWISRDTPVTSFLSSIAMGSDAMIAAGADGTLLRSVDEGLTWAVVNLGTSDWLYRVRWLENQFIVTGENGALFSSPNGLSWTQRASGSSKWLTDVSFADGQWFITGYHGTLLTSTNLVDWVSLPVPTGKSLFTTATMNSQLLVAGVEGVTLRNRTVPVTTPVTVVDYHQSSSTDANGLESVYELFLFGGQPDQVFDFEFCTNLTGESWGVYATLELYDPSGTLYAIRTRDASNAAACEFFTTRLQP